MKKILTTLACGAILATTASADMARLEMGAGVWNQTPTGIMSYTDSLGVTGAYTSDEKEDSTGYVWMLIKHPIPIVPNLRLEYTNLKDTGIIDGSFEAFELPGTSPTVAGSLELTQFDVIPYYNILDNTAWTTLDIGIDFKVQKTTFEAEDVEVGGVTENYSDSETIVIPMAYARVRVEIPGTDIGLEADGKYITYDGSTISDFRAKVDYTLSFIPVIQPAIEIGYRVQKFDITVDEDDSSESKMDMEFSGVYAGLMLRF